MSHTYVINTFLLKSVLDEWNIVIIDDMAIKAHTYSANVLAIPCFEMRVSYCSCQKNMYVHCYSSVFRYVLMISNMI